MEITMADEPIQQNEFKEFLGDGVYAEWDGYHIVLKTGNDRSPDNVVYLDHYVRSALKKYMAKLEQMLTAGNF